MRTNKPAEIIEASVPGNLLISGEYIILEDEGHGLALACGPEARGRCWPGKTSWSVIHAITGEGAISLNTATGIEDPPFVIKIFRALESELAKRGLKVPVLELEIDTRDFFIAGRKRGFGSSAAATVLLSALMFYAASGKGKLSKAEIASAAVIAHREAQGKRGSGYDILTSCFGAAGVFIGGEEPIWQPLAESHPLRKLRLFSFQGPKEVDTRDAVRRYQGWKQAAPESSGDFIRRSQELVQNLEACTDETELIKLINESRLMSAELGDSIGVESWISPPSPFYERAAWKGSGAGNELGLLFLSAASQSAVPDEYEPLEVREQGLVMKKESGELLI